MQRKRIDPTSDRLTSRIIGAISSLHRQKHLKNQLALFSIFCFVTSSSLLPTFASHAVHMGGSNDDYIPFEDESIEELLKNSDMVISQNDGVLANPIMSDVQALPDGKKVRTYIVKTGDTLSSLATGFNIDPDTIVFNNTIPKGEISPGETLYIPPVDGLLYEVKENKELSDIATEYKTDLASLAEINDLTPKAKLQAGERLVVPGMKHVIAMKEKLAEEELAEKNRIAEEVRLEQAKRNSLLAAKEKQRIADAKAASVAKATQSNTVATLKNPPANTKYATKVGKRFVWPTQSPVITTSYKSGHPGLDIAFVSGDHTTAIVAVAAGKVVLAQGGWNGGYGNTILVDHGNGLRTRYAHMRELYVKVGDSVVTGETIGWMGKTGNVRGRTGLHLHFEVLQGKNRVNPYSYL